jgi:hypothetical protein
VVNDLKALMRENVAAPPHDYLDVDALLDAGRRRVRGRRAAVVGGPALLVAGVVAVAAVSWPYGTDRAGAADKPPTPDAPTLGLADAEQAIEGRDYRVLASYTNENLDRDNGQYFDGVTDDGLILFQDGPRMGQPRPRMALMDPATDAKDWLPDLDVGQTQTWPVELGTDRLVLLGAEGGMKVHLVAYVFDRDSRQWSSMTWPSLPAVDQPRAVLGPDDRLYVFVPATQGQPPEGGWPTGRDGAAGDAEVDPEGDRSTGRDGEADDADAEGDTYHLWSASLTDLSDVRDEGLTVGDLTFTDSSMVWTDSTNGDAGMVHVRDLATGEEHSFDPHAGERCNLLSFGASDDRVVMGQYCGTYAGGVRDDRVQILTTDGDQVVTIQDSGIDGALAGSGRTGDVVTVTAYPADRGGTYVYDLGTDRFLRVSDAVSKWGMGGPAPDGEFLWGTPVNEGHGATQWLGQLLADH